jgi:release factor glutamine methyltransferase
LCKGYDILKEQNIDSYMLDCQLILGKVLNQDRMSIIINKDLDVEEEYFKEYLKLVELRKLRMPLKYITNKCEFMGIDFFVKEGVLIPRPDTEILVEEIIKEIEHRKFTKICDVCCGSGAIGLSIAKIIDYTVVDLCDVSNAAEEVTEKNIEILSLSARTKFIKSDLLNYALDEKKYFDVIVSNPPYIRTDVIPELMEDVKNYEPYIALWGGDDGLEFYRNITKQSCSILNNGGVLAYEIGHDQAEDVISILTSNGYTNIRCVKDLGGHDRVVIGINN